MKVKITDKSSEFYGKEFEGNIIYYDYKFTGNSDDVYIVHTDKGDKRFLTSQIDAEYYEKQLLEEFIKKLGASVGDTVKIIKCGSGSYSQDFEENGQHKITKINSSGYVQFDNGEAEFFRPKVKVISKMPKVESFSIGVSR